MGKVKSEKVGCLVLRSSRLGDDRWNMKEEKRLLRNVHRRLFLIQARRQIVERLMSSERNDLSVEETNEIARLTEGYSGADMKNVCQEASLGPIRSLSFSDMHQISAEQVCISVNSLDPKSHHPHVYRYFFLYYQSKKYCSVSRSCHKAVAYICQGGAFLRM